jgi:hypothetical protein
MQHTFIFQPGNWKASGTFWTADGQALQADGRSEVSHAKECWMIAGKLRVLASPPVEFVNIYCMAPPAKDALTSKWTMENATLGKLHGVFSIVGSSIMSMYRSENGGYYGSEHLLHVDADHYEAYGMLLMEDRRLSSWHVELKREAAVSGHPAASVEHPTADHGA